MSGENLRAVYLASQALSFTYISLALLFLPTKLHVRVLTPVFLPDDLQQSIRIILVTTAERVSSVFSVLGSVFVIGTYLYSEAFHKPINRLVFYASFGNMATNVATLISRSGIAAGVTSPLCQLQAFILQMFMPADSLWTLAMAFNVYLTFFHRYSASQLRSLEWKYLLICYGVPLVPAIVFVFAGTEDRGRIFGSATLWCWITVEWNALRIAIFYGPVWVVLVITMSIYALVGKIIYKNHRQFRNLSTTTDNATATAIPNDGGDSGGAPVNSKTTEVHITTESALESGFDTPFDSDRDNFKARPNTEKYPRYAVNIESPNETTARNDGEVPQRRTTSTADRAAWAYLKCAMLFFIALLITWVPATINRVATLVKPELVSFPLDFIESIFLPLQGFWNAVIYISTSIPACKALLSPPRRSFIALTDLPRRRTVMGTDTPASKSESMVDLRGN
ncbi:hypothetical protein V500_04683 [Pseudogymnoascus sp. VKM F-4518 (FW-2643)]|nr:hypothetical protein V500_04683 [Pseudogymnoascus sp. VKM F-4518 (FW-2643)]